MGSRPPSDGSSFDEVNEWDYGDRHAERGCSSEVASFTWVLSPNHRSQNLTIGPHGDRGSDGCRRCGPV